MLGDSGRENGNYYVMIAHICGLYQDLLSRIRGMAAFRA